MTIDLNRATAKRIACRLNIGSKMEQSLADEIFTALQVAQKRGELIAKRLTSWNDAATSKPAGRQIVLLGGPLHEEDVWLGYWSGNGFFKVDGTRPVAVTCWAEISVEMPINQIVSDLVNLLQLVRDLDQRIHSGYDWNADPDEMTLRVGDVLNSIGPTTNIQASPGRIDSVIPVWLRDDAPFLLCSKCGRKSYGGEELNAPCDMPQPDDRRCDGVFQRAF